MAKAKTATKKSTTIGTAAAAALAQGKALTVAKSSSDFKPEELLARKDVLFQPALLKAAITAETKSQAHWKDWTIGAHKHGFRSAMIAGKDAAGKTVANPLREAFRDCIARAALNDREYSLVTTKDTKDLTGAQMEERRTLMQSPVGYLLSRTEGYLKGYEKALEKQAAGEDGAKDSKGAGSGKRSLGERCAEFFDKRIKEINKKKSTTTAEREFADALTALLPKCKLLVD